MPTVLVREKAELTTASKGDRGSYRANARLPGEPHQGSASAIVVPVRFKSELQGHPANPSRPLPPRPLVELRVPHERSRRKGSARVQTEGASWRLSDYLGTKDSRTGPKTRGRASEPAVSCSGDAVRESAAHLRRFPRPAPPFPPRTRAPAKTASWGLPVVKELSGRRLPVRTCFATRPRASCFRGEERRGASRRRGEPTVREADLALGWTVVYSCVDELEAEGGRIEATGRPCKFKLGLRRARARRNALAGGKPCLALWPRPRRRVRFDRDGFKELAKGTLHRTVCVDKRTPRSQDARSGRGKEQNIERERERAKKQGAVFLPTVVVLIRTRPKLPSLPSRPRDPVPLLGPPPGCYYRA